MTPYRPVDSPRFQAHKPLSPEEEAERAARFPPPSSTHNDAMRPTYTWTVIAIASFALGIALGYGWLVFQFALAGLIGLLIAILVVEDES